MCAHSHSHGHTHGKGENWWGLGATAGGITLVLSSIAWPQETGHLPWLLASLDLFVGTGVATGLFVLLLVTLTEAAVKQFRPDRPP